VENDHDAQTDQQRTEQPPEQHAVADERAAKADLHTTPRLIVLSL
jgi:hypothetical protein